MTWHRGRWYAGATVGVLAVVSGLTLFGYWAARGREALFGATLD